MKKELSTCVIRKFNGYELLRNHLNSKERKDFIPIDVAYEPSLNENKPILCYYAPKIYLGFHTTVENREKDKRFLTILELDNAIIATTFLLRVMKR